MKKLYPKRAWADVGSHGGIMEFFMGPVATLYPNLLHIYTKKHSNDLVEIEIRRVVKPKKKVHPHNNP